MGLESRYTLANFILNAYKATNQNCRSDQIFHVGICMLLWLQMFVLLSGRHVSPIDTLLVISIPDPGFTSQTLIGINPGHSKSRSALPVDVMCSTGQEPKLAVILML